MPAAGLLRRTSEPLAAGSNLDFRQAGAVFLCLGYGEKKIGSQGVNVGNAACGDIALLRAHNGSVLLHFWVFVPP